MSKTLVGQVYVVGIICPNPLIGIGSTNLPKKASYVPASLQQKKGATRKEKRTQPKNMGRFYVKIDRQRTPI